MEELKQHLRDKLYPHLGYFNLISKFIDRNEIRTVEEVDFITSKLENKVLIKSLPKNINGYKNYYFLVFDIISAEEKNRIVRFLKDNIPSCSRNFFIESISNEESLRALKSVIKSESKLEIFLRWSSRIKNETDASLYINDVFKEEGRVNLIYGLEGLNNVDGFDILEMNNFEAVREVIPASWCIKNPQTFQQYLDGNIMYLFIKDREIYGINIPRHDTGYGYGLQNISVIDKNNKAVYGGIPWDDFRAHIDLHDRGPVMDFPAEKKNKNGLFNRIRRGLSKTWEIN